MKKVFNAAKREFIDIRFGKFLVFGITGAAVNLGIGGFLYSSEATEVLMPYWAAITVASFCSMSISFSLNYFFNFQFRLRSVVSQFRTYLLFSVIGIALVAGMAEGLLRLSGLLFTGERFSLGPWTISFKFASHFCAVGSVAMYSFIVNKYISFNIGLRGRLMQLWNANRP